MSRTRPLCIGISGGTGSGKTTVTREILRRVGPDQIVVLNHDRYYKDLARLPMTERRHRNFDHPNALDTGRMQADLLCLLENRPAEVPVYDFTRHVRLAETEVVQPLPVIVVEGILILSEQRLRELMDVKIFVDTDADLRFIRRLERDMAERERTSESVIEQYLDSVRPMHLEFVEPSKRWADVIIPEGGYNTVALDLVISRIERLLDTARVG